MVCLLAALWVQLSVSAGNGWPHNALWHHWLMPISCHFRDCKALLITSLTHISGAITSVLTFSFTTSVGFKAKLFRITLGLNYIIIIIIIASHVSTHLLIHLSAHLYYHHHSRHPSLFHSGFKTYLFNKSFPPLTSFTYRTAFMTVGLIVLFLVSLFNFLFVPCGGLSWLPVSFLLHVKYTLSYRIVL